VDWLVEPLATFGALLGNKDEPKDAKCSGAGTQLNACSCTGGLVSCSCTGGLNIEQK
jgi:hypothetical protein